MGHQYPLTLGEDEFALDILFYHTILHCYVVVDLKTRKFIPEFALKDMTKPIGISEYRFTQELPEEMQKAFPEPNDWVEHIVIDDTDNG